MRKRVQISLAVLLVAIFGLLGGRFSGFREPVYQGKRLSVCLEQYGTNHWTAPDRELDRQAETTIRKIGTNAVPILLELMASKESPLRMKLWPRTPNRWWTYHYLAWLTQYQRKMSELRRLGAYGFAALARDPITLLPRITCPPAQG